MIAFRLSRSRKPAYALATILVLLGAALFAVGALVSISALESNIARSQTEGTVAYYVAEAGMADAVWQLNNNPTYQNALASGTLNASYTVNNNPQTGQSFTVTMQTSGAGAGHATVTIDASHDNGSFTARRRVSAEVFAGSTGGAPSIGTNGFLAGGNLSMTNGASTIQLSGGDIYVRGNISVIQATVNAGTNILKARGNYSQVHGNVTSGGIQAANYPPPPSENIQVPGVNFTDYRNNASHTYTPAQFINRIQNGQSFAGPITYVSGNVTFNSNVRNDTLNLTGILVINGNFTINNSASNFTMNINNPGNFQSGVLVSGNMTFRNGTMNLNGVLFSAGNTDISSLPSFQVNGAVVSAGNTAFTAGGLLSITFNAAYAGAVLGGGGGTVEAVEVQHWEEEY